jgi:hypothetical protein
MSDLPFTHRTYLGSFQGYDSCSFPFQGSKFYLVGLIVPIDMNDRTDISGHKAFRGNVNG